MDRPRKILFVLEGYFPFRKAGTEIYVRNLVNHLRKMDFLIEILITSTDPSQKSYEFEGTRVHVITVTGTPGPKELNGIIPPQGFEAFKKKVNSIDPDIAHFHSFGRAINSRHLQWAGENGIKTVFTTHLGGLFCVRGSFLLHGNEVCDGKVDESRCLVCWGRTRGIPASVSKLAGNWLRFEQYRVAGKLLPQAFLVKNRLIELERLKTHCDAIIAIAPWIRGMYGMNGIIEKVHLVEQGIDVPPGIKRNGNRESGSLKLGFVGRMNPSKGFHLLRQALLEIESTGIELNVFTLTGSDDIEYCRENKEWALADGRVTWSENVDHDVLMEEVAQLDLLVLPSVSNEVAPLVILEANRLRVPVLGSGYPAIRDLISEGVTGQIFQHNNPSDLKDKLVSIISDPEILDFWSARIPVVRSTEMVADDMVQIYNTL